MKNHFGIPFSDIIKNKNNITLDKELSNKIIYVKKFKNNRKEEYIYILYRDISRLEIGLTSERANGAFVENYYFTFKMKDNEWIDIDIDEAPKFMDLIKIAGLEDRYNEIKNKSNQKEEEIEK